jgi:hypothetical protein
VERDARQKRTGKGKKLTSTRAKYNIYIYIYIYIGRVGGGVRERFFLLPNISYSAILFTDKRT